MLQVFLVLGWLSLGFRKADYTLFSEAVTEPFSKSYPRSHMEPNQPPFQSTVCKGPFLRFFVGLGFWEGSGVGGGGGRGDRWSVAVTLSLSVQ